MDLNSARIEINEVDKEIVSCLEKRFNLALEIGKYKSENNLPIYDEVREKKVIENCIGYLSNKNYARHIENIYKQIMDSSKELQL
ncbi:chorismate mutase [Sedimentibacter sp.]|uniref:chorismate mutase n=1 Tax=Sedimentibacter sp. TaxID=1960295 RepID=UPI0028A855BE|nr:chorismate mutase [Sedimentibacter sp.]